jgi:predicted short-subunit dehydrogenase-like oxidoreductase (DUF2520 family)
MLGTARGTPHQARMKEDAMGPIGIAGAGRVARALGRILRERGEPVVAVASRDDAHSAAAARFIGGAVAVPYSELPRHADRVLIAVSDSAIREVASTLAVAGFKSGAALHTCGAHGPEILAPLAAAGVSCGALHPLQTFATAEQGLSVLPGAAFAITGDGAAREWAEQIVRLLQGLPLRIPASHRTAYHAAAVMASNYTAGLIHAAVSLMGQAGVDEPAALRAIGPLVRASVENALALGPVEALTGPVARGDLETVSRHRSALAATGERPIRALYDAGARYILEIARIRGMPPAVAHRFEELLRGEGDQIV